MKWMIASDIHGSAAYLEKLLEAYKQEKADRMLLLGDLLYHGAFEWNERRYSLCPGKLRGGSGSDGAGISGDGRICNFDSRYADDFCNPWACFQ